MSPPPPDGGPREGAPRLGIDPKGDSGRVALGRVLLTGAHGFVGSYVRRALADYAPGATVTAVGSKRGPRQRGCRTIDVLDRSAVFDLVAEIQPEVVIHLAAQSSVGLAQGGAVDLTWIVNVAGTLNLALAVARHAPAASVVFASSAEVYGMGDAGRQMTEDTRLAPVNAYARSKLIAERLIADILAPTTQLIIARPFNCTGPGQRETFVLPSSAAQIARAEAGLQEPRLRIGNLDVIRDFLDVRDVARAYVDLIGARSTLPARLAVNIASGRPYRLRDLLDRLRRMASISIHVEVDRARLRLADVPVAYGAADRLHAATGWSPQIDMDETLVDLLAAARAAARKEAAAHRPAFAAHGDLQRA